MYPFNDAIERLYQAFTIVPKPKRIDGCPCCIDRKRVDALLRKALRATTPDELAPYASSAFLTVGEAADYLYFLPRILEITAREPPWHPGPEITSRAIRTANPEAWTVAQRSALNDFLESVVGAAITTSEYHLLDGWLCAVALMGFNVRPYLAQVAACPAAVLDYFEQNVQSLPQNSLANGFWELWPCPEHDTIADWFYSPEIARIPFEAYGFVLARNR